MQRIVGATRCYHSLPQPALSSMSVMAIYHQQSKTPQDSLLCFREFRVKASKRTGLQEVLMLETSADAQAAFADALNMEAFFLTNSCTLRGACPVNVSTSSVIRSYRPARCRSAIAARWLTR